MSKKLRELQARKSAVVTDKADALKQAGALLDQAAAETRDLSAEEQIAFDSFRAGATAKSSDIERLQAQIDIEHELIVVSNGKSRKKIVSYTCRQPSQEQQTYYDNLRDIRERISRDGIDLEVTTSWKRERLSWATGVSLVVPLEVRCETELALVAKLARRLMLGQTTLEVEFPGYRYGKTDWLREQNLR